MCKLLCYNEFKGSGVTCSSLYHISNCFVCRACITLAILFFLSAASITCKAIIALAAGIKAERVCYLKIIQTLVSYGYYVFF